MSIPFGSALIAVAMVAASGAAHAQTYYVQPFNPVVSEPIAVTPVERTTVYRNIFPQGPGLAPIIRERVVTEQFAPDPVRTRVVVQPRETVVVAPRDYNYASYGVAPRDYNYNYGYEVVTQPVVTERVVTVPGPRLRSAEQLSGAGRLCACRRAGARSGLRGRRRAAADLQAALPLVRCGFRDVPRLHGLRHPCR